jgi:hypothetical protein
MAAYSGVLGNALGLAFFCAGSRYLLLIISALVLQIWLILIGRRLYQLSKGISKEEAKTN